MGGVTFVPLRRRNRETAGVAGGDTIEVTLTLDTAPRTVTPPTDLVAAIHAAGLEAACAKQSYTRQREAAEAVEGAKQPETRPRRTKAAIASFPGKSSPIPHQLRAEERRDGKAGATQGRNRG